MGVYQGPCCMFGWWWIMPLIMIVFCILMMFLMGKRMPEMMGRMMRPPALEATQQNHPGAPTDSAKEILDKRYALGEISTEEYEERRKALSGG